MPEFWIDCLHEKHECWTYERSRKPIPIKLGQRQVQLHMPSYLTNIEILVTAEHDGILFLLAPQPQQVGAGVRMRRRGDGRQET
jgi:hypothetical protein